ncbi:unnamed protein product [Adineta steineri]|uniref:Uncharacterized protein n=1 Tax=Adineta steineri TaxID=433720 RepID=A0A814YMQ1_9BILA|nr:unnamed protein product [Adineta steineri]
MDDHGIMACTENEYFSYNPPTSSDRRSIGSFNSIFELNDPNISTCFTNISPGQYLLNGPHVGVTTSLEGTSQRAPIMFTSPPLNFVYSHPYLIVLVKDYMQIYSFFPTFISPIISVFANTIFEIFVKIKLCQPYVKKYNASSSSSVTITIPGAEAADADRRRILWWHCTA